MKSLKQSIQFENKVYLNETASVVGRMEGEGPLGSEFDRVNLEDMCGCDTWEEAESSLQCDAVYLLLAKCKLQPEDVDLFFSGDLLGQSIASSFGIKRFQIPVIGLFGACSTCGEALAMGASFMNAGYASHIVCTTSSHFASAEKEFRFPLGYGNQKPLSAGVTVTGGAAFMVSGQPMVSQQSPQAASICITGVTIGKIMDYGVKDSMNMGCAMAPAAADTIRIHLEDFKRKPDYYDKIITGDLGKVGKEALFQLLGEHNIDISSQYEDCGLLIYDTQRQDALAGGSGCGCAASVMAAFIFKKMRMGEWKRVLLVTTGALLSKTSFNEGLTIPGIAHGVVFEIEG